jgi:molybdopterin/thiamine biosynthesis adenylyltransferase
LFVTIPEETAKHVRDWAPGDGEFVGGVLAGRVVDEGDVVQIAGVADDPHARVGLWGRTPYPDRPPQAFRERTRPGEVVVLTAGESPPLWVGIRLDEGWQQVNYGVIRLHADFTSRLDGLFDSRYLADKTVTVIGLGTGGSLVAVELAKNGVGKFRLVDFDRLETHNVARHACGLSDIGRYKTRALADLLRDRHPAAHVETHEFNVLRDRERLAQVIAGSNLVVTATDSEASKRSINEVCWLRGVPAVYGAAYDRAFGGDVLRVVPPDSACYECFYKQITEIFETAPKKTIDYSAEDPTKVVAEPGLGLDVAFIGLILAKMALLTLLRGTRSTLDDFPKDYVMWGNRREWVFDQPLQSMYMDVAVNPTCRVCHPEAYAVQELGMTLAQARELGQKALEEVKTMDTVSLEELGGQV